MEWEAGRFARRLEELEEMTDQDPQKSTIQLAAQLEGRFRFLWGIYRAHSEVESVGSMHFFNSFFLVNVQKSTFLREYVEWQYDLTELKSFLQRCFPADRGTADM